jgi:hypothetical protein
MLKQSSGRNPVRCHGREAAIGPKGAAQCHVSVPAGIESRENFTVVFECELKGKALTIRAISSVLKI